MDRGDFKSWEDAVELFNIIAVQYAKNPHFYKENQERTPLSALDTHQIILTCLDSRYICAKSVEKAWQVYEIATNKLGHLLEESLVHKLHKKRKNFRPLRKR